MQGWIKLHRRFVDWEWYSDIVTKTVFVDLLLAANHQNTKWQGKIVKKGEVITSVKKIAERNNLTIQQVRTALNKLEKTGEINKQTTNKNTLIKVLGYAKYQGCDNDDFENINKQITINQQTNNNQITTNKNDKNVKNINNDNKRETEKDKQTDFKYIKEEFVPPSLDEIKSYIRSINLNTNAEDFFDYYSANGWTVKGVPMRDWKAMCRKWSRSDNKNCKPKKHDTISRPPSYDLEKIKRDAMMNTTI